MTKKKGYSENHKVKEAIKKFFEENPSYQKFQEIDWEKELRGLVKQKEISADRLWESGMLVHLQALMLYFYADDLLDDWRKGRVKATQQEFKKFMEGILKCARGEIGDQRKDNIFQDWSVFSNPTEPEKQRLHTGGNKDLFDALTGWLSEEKETMDVIVPDGFVEIREPISTEKVEEEINIALARGQSTVRNLATGIKEAENHKHGIAVTFQACLQLECEGKVSLGQLLDDVSVQRN